MMKKTLFTLLVGATLIHPRVSAFALTPLSHTTMKTPTAQAGLSIPLDEVRAFQRIVQLFYSDTDGIMGSSASPANVIVKQGIQTTPEKISAITAHGSLLPENNTESDRERRFPSTEIDETTRTIILSNDIENSGSTFEAPPPLPAGFNDNSPIDPTVSVLKSNKCVIESYAR